MDRSIGRTAHVTVTPWRKLMQAGGAAAVAMLVGQSMRLRAQERNGRLYFFGGVALVVADLWPDQPMDDRVRRMVTSQLYEHDYATLSFEGQGAWLLPVNESWTEPEKVRRETIVTPPPGPVRYRRAPAKAAKAHGGNPAPSFDVSHVVPEYVYDHREDGLHCSECGAGPFDHLESARAHWGSSKHLSPQQKRLIELVGESPGQKVGAYADQLRAEGFEWLGSMHYGQPLVKRGLLVAVGERAARRYYPGKATKRRRTASQPAVRTVLPAAQPEPVSSHATAPRATPEGSVEVLLSGSGITMERIVDLPTAARIIALLMGG